MSETLPATAIDTALIKGNRGCQFLEIQRPTKQDLKTAAEAFKDASDILKASLVLLDHDCYLVQDPPQAAGTPLFKATGEPTNAADVTTQPEPQKEIAGTLGCIDVEIVEASRTFKVGDLVEDVSDGERGTIIADDGDDEENEPYTVKFANNGLGMLSASGLKLVDGTEEDDHAIENEPFPAGSKAVQRSVFGERLDTLEDIFCERLDLAGNTEPYGKQLKMFKPHREAWMALWKTSPRTAWTTLLHAIAKANALDVESPSWAPAA